MGVVGENGAKGRAGCFFGEAARGASRATRAARAFLLAHALRSLARVIVENSPLCTSFCLKTGERDKRACLAVMPPRSGGDGSAEGKCPSIHRFHGAVPPQGIRH